MAGTRITPVRMPDDVVEAVDRRVGAGRRSAFVIDAVRRELARLAQADALRDAAGAWRAEDHPDLPDTVQEMGEVLRHLRVQAAPERR